MGGYIPAWYARPGRAAKGVCPRLPLLFKGSSRPTFAHVLATHLLGFEVDPPLYMSFQDRTLPFHIHITPKISNYCPSYPNATPQH